MHDKGKAETAQDRASSHWQEIRGRWQEHVAKVRTRVKEQEAELDAKVAAADADMAEGYALDASISPKPPSKKPSTRRSMRCMREPGPPRSVADRGSKGPKRMERDAATDRL